MSQNCGNCRYYDPVHWDSGIGECLWNGITPISIYPTTGE